MTSTSLKMIQISNRDVFFSELKVLLKKCLQSKLKDFKCGFLFYLNRGNSVESFQIWNFSGTHSVYICAKKFREVLKFYKRSKALKFAED